MLAAAFFLLAPALQGPPGAVEMPRERLLRTSSPLRRRAVRIDEDGRARRVVQTVGNASIEVVYDNTCFAGGYYFPTRPGAQTGGSLAETFTHTGRVPSTASAGVWTCSPGVADAYQIARIEIAYCTTTGSPVDLVQHFWDPPRGACNAVVGGTVPPTTPTAASHTMAGLPRSASAGTQACYLIQVDLGENRFVLQAGAVSSERFAWSYQFPGTTGRDGVHIAGNPYFGGCGVCVGTIFEDPVQTTNPGSGLDTVDAWYVDSYGGTTDGCYFFGSYYAAYLKLEADLGASVLVTPFCDASDGALSLCPCSNPGAPETGCEIAQGTGGVHMTFTAQDTSALTAVVAATGFPPMASPTAVLMRASSLEPLPVAFGDGVRCVGLTGFARTAATAASGGTSTHAFGHGMGPGTFHYQVWFRNTPVSYCVTTGASMGAFNLSNGESVVW